MYLMKTKDAMMHKKYACKLLQLKMGLPIKNH